MSYNDEYSSTERRGDNTYGSSGFDTTRDNTTGTGNFDRGFEGRDRIGNDYEGRDRAGNDYGVSGGEFGRSDNIGGTGAQRDYRASEGGLGGQDRYTGGDRSTEFSRGDGEFGHGSVRTQDRFDNTGATGTGAYGDRTDDSYGSRGRTDNFTSTGTGVGRDEFNRGDDTFGSSRTGAGYDERTDTHHKPTMGEKIKGTMETVTGKVTRNPEKVEHGRELKSGEVDSNINRNY